MRKSGATTCAPISPPVVTVFEKIRSGCNVEKMNSEQISATINPENSAKRAGGWINGGDDTRKYDPASANQVGALGRETAFLARPAPLRSPPTEVESVGCIATSPSAWPSGSASFGMLIRLPWVETFA